MKSNEIRCAFSLLLLVALTACGGSGSSAKAKSTDPALDLPQVVSEPAATGANGVAIDPTQKTIIVVGDQRPSNDDAGLESRLTVLDEESAATTVHVQEQIDSVAARGVPAAASPAMVGDLETYKAQALETVKARQRLADPSQPGDAP
jgi:hypothetical protein